jgi:hypothetical protein
MGDDIRIALIAHRPGWVSSQSMFSLALSSGVGIFNLRPSSNRSTAFL